MVLKRVRRLPEGLYIKLMRTVHAEVIESRRVKKRKGVKGNWRTIGCPIPFVSSQSRTCSHYLERYPELWRYNFDVLRCQVWQIQAACSGSSTRRQPEYSDSLWKGRSEKTVFPEVLIWLYDTDHRYVVFEKSGVPSILASSNRA